MSKSKLKYEDILSHEFVTKGLRKAVDVSMALQTGSIVKVEQEYIRELDEYEFYVIDTGHKLAHLLGQCEQLVHAVLFLSAFSPTKRMKGAGITRANHLQFNVENYLIRTQSLYDRVLKVANSVFHLGLRPQDCRHDTIAKNVHVKGTKIPQMLQSIRKLLEKYRQDRNIIIHHEAFQENELRKIEMFYLIQKDGKVQDDNLSPDVISYTARNLTRKYVEQKIEEFDEFNVSVFNLLEKYFSELTPKYFAMVERLSARCGHNA